MSADVEAGIGSATVVGSSRLSVGGTPNEYQIEVGYGESDPAYFTPWLVDTVINGTGGL